MGFIEIIGLISGLIAIGSAITILLKKYRRKKLTIGSGPTPYLDQKSRVLFNNGWDGFDINSDRDVLFQLPLSAPRDFLRYIELMRPYRSDVYDASEKGISVNPRQLEYPYEASAIISVCVGSSKTGRQSDRTYDDLFGRYKPIVPKHVQIHVLDGNEEAMWMWQSEIPTSWIIDDRPFVSPDGRKAMSEMLDKWLWAHDAEVRRMRGESYTA